MRRNATPFRFFLFKCFFALLTEQHQFEPRQFFNWHVLQSRENRFGGRVLDHNWHGEIRAVPFASLPVSSALWGQCDRKALEGDTLLLMNEAVVNPSTSSDAQYQAEAENWLAQIRLLNEQSSREWTRIEQLRAESQTTLARMEATLARLEAR